eukprot:279516_1
MKMSHSYPILHYLVIISQIVIAFICCFLLCFIRAQYFIMDKTFGRIEKWSIAAISMFAISAVAFALELLVFLLDMNVYIADLAKAIWAFAWRSGLFCIYISFIQRFTHIFKDTKYAMVPRTKCTFIILCIIFVCIQWTHFIMWILLNVNVIKTTDFNVFSLVKLIVEQLLDLLLNIGLMR